MKTKRRLPTSKKFQRNGMVSASESPFTGQEPTWEGADEWSQDKINHMFGHALNFYNYYLTTDDYIPIIEKYVNNDKKTSSILRRAPKCVEISICGKIARMLNLGMPRYHNKVDYGIEVERYIQTISKMVPVKTKKVLSKRISVFELMQKKLRKEVLVYLDKMLDEWIVSPTTKIYKINLSSLLSGVNAPISSLGIVVKWLEGQRDELIEARDKTNSHSVEGYSYLSKPAIKKRISLLNEMLNDVDLYKSAKKAIRKPRIKKEKSADKIVSKLKYQNSSGNFGVISINPIKIVGSSKVYLFNEKYRKLTILYTSSLSGLTVKGTTIRNFEDNTSYAIKLRKPKDILSIIVSKTERQITNALKKLTTKKISANGRVNENTIILKA